MGLDQPLAPDVRGVSGTLLPAGFLAAMLTTDPRTVGVPAVPTAVGRTLRSVWGSATHACGPATALRALFDLLLDPLVTTLGFRIRQVEFHAHHGEVVLATGGGTPVAMLLLPWSSAPSSAWKDLVHLGHTSRASWGIVLAPPFFSLLRTAGQAVRHSVDFCLPLVLESSLSSLFWRLARAEAFDPTSVTTASGHESGHVGRIPTYLDLLVDRAASFQDQVRSDLQNGVVSAVQVVSAALGHTPTRRLAPLRPPQSTMGLTARDEALTIVYRVLFLLFAESRGLAPLDNPIYERAYSMNALCRRALSGATDGNWDCLAAMSRLARLGCRSDSLHATSFNGRLFAKASAPSLEGTARAARRVRDADNRDTAISSALVSLATRRNPAGRSLISYRDLGVEQLGAVYEHLLNDEPNSASARESSRLHSRQRKQTGTFYTPQPLAEFVVRRTLAPLVHGASADSILSLRVVDPAMGSGACLVAACRYLSVAYERALIEEGRAASDDFDEYERANVRRLIAERCLAGVDRNPTAVELARLSLWLTTLARDRPLGFLDHRLRVGDSLVGAWPDDLGRLSRTTSARPSDLPLFDASDLDDALTRAAEPVKALLNRRDDTTADVHEKAAIWRRLSSEASPLHAWRRASSLWCARWFWPDARPGRPDAAETRALMDAILRQDRTLSGTHVAARRREVGMLDTAHAFFHWPLEFPDVFRATTHGSSQSVGFDAVIGNPPWEMLRRDEEQPDIDPRVLLRYLRESGQYPSCTRGHLNLYQAFLDRAIALARPGGRVGLVLPWSLASDDGAVGLRTRLLEQCALDTLVGFDNARGLFPIHRGVRFLAVTATPGHPTTETRARFGVMTAGELDTLPDREDGTATTAYPVRLTPRALRAAGGPLLRFPDARRPGDLEWLGGLSTRFPCLGDGWGISFGRELNATEVRPVLGATGLPVIDGKHVSPFSVTSDPTRRLAPDMARRMLPRLPFDRPRLAYRDVSGVANRQTLIAAIVPAGVVTTHTLFCLSSPLAIDRQYHLCALLNSYVLNAVVRMLMGGHLTTTLIEGLPAPTWNGDRSDRQTAAISKRLSDAGYSETLAARLQARVARRFGLTAADFRRVLDGFPLVPATVRDRAWREFGDTAAS